MVVHRVELVVVWSREVLDVKFDQSSGKLVLLTESDRELV